MIESNGRGVPGLMVGAWVKSFRYGRPWITFRGSSLSNDGGSFQLAHLRAGFYVIGILPAILKPKIGMPDASEAVITSVYTRSFYSNSPSMAYASDIRVDSGQETTNSDIPAKKVNGYCITTSLPTWLSRSIELVVNIAEAGSATEMSIGTRLLKGGREFHFCGVPSGDYIVSAFASTGEGTRWANRLGWMGASYGR